MIKLPYPDVNFRCSEEDWPWRYADKGMNGNRGGTRPDQLIHPPYEPMPLEDIYKCQSEVVRTLSPSCHRWVWTVEPFLVDTILMLKNFGFEVKRQFIWVKTTDGLSKRLKGLSRFSPQRIREALEVMVSIGYPGKPYPRGGGRYWGKTCCEYLLLATNDRSFQILNRKKESQVFFAPSPEHSAKPDIAYEIIKRNSPGPRLSLFQRTPREGFECWGDQLKEAASE